MNGKYASFEVRRGILSKMPNIQGSWEITKLEYLASKIQYGYTAKSSNKKIGPRLLRITDIQNDSVTWNTVPYCEINEKDKLNYLLNQNDIVFARTGATVGKSYLITGEIPESVFASYLIRVQVNEGVNSRYLAYYFRSPDYWDQIIENAAGIGQPNVNGTKLAQLKIPIAPINEQKRIADKLDQTLAIVERAKARLVRVPEILKQFRQSVLAAGTDGRLTEDWRNEFGGNSQWKTVNVGSLLTDIRYGTAKKCHYEPKEIPVIRIPNLTDGRITHENMKYAKFDESEYQKLALIKGDILIIRSNGSVDLVGRTALVSEKEDGFLYAGYLIRIRANLQRVISPYLSLALSSPNCRNSIVLTARSTSGVNNINTEEIKALSIELPEIFEQHEIVRRVETLFALADRIEARYQAIAQHVDKLTQALLAKAFRGELVPQDPNDEPASELLARIAATPRATSTTKPNTRKPPTPKPVRAPKENAAMTKSRQDEEVKDKPYLAEHLRLLGGSTPVEALFKASELPVADFYKQLAWEVEQGFVRDGESFLEVADEA